MKVPAATSILIVEDIPTYARYLRELLRLAEIDAEITETGRVEFAEELMKRNRFSCVLLDLTLPNGQGQAVIERLLRFQQPLVVVTAKEDPETRRMALRSGAQEYIEKSKLTAIAGPQIMSRLVETAIDRGEGVGHLISAYARALVDASPEEKGAHG